MSRAQNSDEESTIVIDCDFDAPPERVFAAVTEPDLVAEWLSAEVPGVGEVTYTLLEASPCALVRYHVQSEEGEHAVDSCVTIQLTPTREGGTRMKLVHDDFRVRDNDTVALARAA